MIKIEPVFLSFRITLEVIFLGIILLFFIIQIIPMDCDHWIFYIIQIPTFFFKFITWSYLCFRKWANNIGWNGFSAWSSLPCWIYNQFNILIIMQNIKALLYGGQKLYTKNTTAQVIVLIQRRDVYHTR